MVPSLSSCRTPPTATATYQIRVHGECLPGDDAVRASWIRRMFPDHIVESARIAGQWSLSLRMPDDPCWYVDPDLDEGLRWWSPGTTAADVPFACRREARFQLSMLDSWSLVAWSRWLRDERDLDRLPRTLVILHADEHDDLASPHLVSTGRGWTDLLTGHEFDVFDPDSVTAAVVSGAVGIASFVVPLFHAGFTVQVRHLRATAPRSARPRTLGLAPGRLEDPALGEGVFRPCVRSSEAEDAGSYTWTCSPAEWVRDVPEGDTVLLHLDLDYLNNRFDGSPRWASRSDRHDPPEPVVLRALDHLLSALRDSNTLARSVDTSVALSPGFFPAELWAAAVTRLDKQLGASATREHP